MTALVILIVITVAALLAVSILNNLQQRRRMRRLQQRRLRMEIDKLQDIVTCLEQTLPSTSIARHINDKIIELLNQVLALEDHNTEHIEASIRRAEERAQQLAVGRSNGGASYQRDSDAQIAKSLLHIQEAIDLLPHLVALGKITEVELDIYLSELRWASLMVPAMSYVGQGDKAMAISDRFSAQAFYRKAQQLLLESLDADPRRLKLIKELGEIIDGSRPSLSRELKEPRQLSLA